MRALLADKRGATSVLVIFMMVVLVVFATLAFTTAYANYKLSQKTANTSANNYALDDLAARMLLQVDTCLANGEVYAQQTVKDGGNANGPIAAMVRNVPHTEALQRLFLQESVRQLEILAQETPGVFVTINAPYEDGDFLDTGRELPGEDTLQITIALTTGDKPGDKQLDVVLDVLPLRYEGGQELRSARATDYTSRYHISQWKQWQVTFTYDDSLQFGDGSIIID